MPGKGVAERPGKKGRSQEMCQNWRAHASTWDKGPTRSHESNAWTSETIGAAGSGSLRQVTRRVFILWQQITTRKPSMLQGDKTVKLFRTFHRYTKALLKYIPQTITDVIKGERNVKEPFGG